MINYTPIYFFGEDLFGRCVKAEPAAVFAALLDFGLRSTFDAADAARLLVTSLFAGRLAILLPHISYFVTPCPN